MQLEQDEVRVGAGDARYWHSYSCGGFVEWHFRPAPTPDVDASIPGNLQEPSPEIPFAELLDVLESSHESLLAGILCPTLFLKKAVAREKN
jgi:hypothetical protein